MAASHSHVPMGSTKSRLAAWQLQAAAMQHERFGTLTTIAIKAGEPVV